MDIVPYEDVLRGVLDEYERKPKGWHVLVAKAQGLGHDVYVFRPEGTMAVLKLESLSVPSPVGIGIEMAEGDRILRGLAERGSHSFGVRPIAPGMLTRILKRAEAGERPSVGMIKEVMKHEPIPVGSVTTPLVLEGPVVRLPSTLPTSLVSSGQRELDTVLRGELERLIRRKYGQLYIG